MILKIIIIWLVVINILAFLDGVVNLVRSKYSVMEQALSYLLSINRRGVGKLILALCAVGCLLYYTILILQMIFRYARIRRSLSKAARRKEKENSTQ